MKKTDTIPAQTSYDVVIIGGAIMGSAAAWFLASNPDFNGRILVVERDPSYALCSTAHSNSCMRQQFSAPINIKISQFAADYTSRFVEEMGDLALPPIHRHFFGYLYLAGDEGFAGHLKRVQKVQKRLGAGTVLLTPDEISVRFPFLSTSGLHLASFGTENEGYFDGGAMFEGWRRASRFRGVEFVANEVVDIETTASRVSALRLKSGERIECGWAVNAAGPRAARVAKMAGLVLPVEPRKRYTWVFEAERPLDRDLPLTIDPTGVHVRTDGAYYMAGATPENDPAVEPDDFVSDHTMWEDRVWPILAERIPAFEAIRVINQWVGHYAFNTLDQNAIVGPDDRIDNFLYMNGFSGHGLQQAPAMGRAIAEWITRGSYQSLDMTELHIDRVRSGVGLGEAAII